MFYMCDAPYACVWYNKLAYMWFFIIERYVLIHVTTYLQLYRGHPRQCVKLREGLMSSASQTIWPLSLKPRYGTLMELYQLCYPWYVNIILDFSERRINTEKNAVQTSINKYDCQMKSVENSVIPPLSPHWLPAEDDYQIEVCKELFNL